MLSKEEDEAEQLRRYESKIRGERGMSSVMVLQNVAAEGNDGELDTVRTLLAHAKSTKKAPTDTMKVRILLS
jgi:hypothetical protein